MLVLQYKKNCIRELWEIYDMKTMPNLKENIFIPKHQKKLQILLRTDSMLIPNLWM